MQQTWKLTEGKKSTNQRIIQLDNNFNFLIADHIPEIFYCVW